MKHLEILKKHEDWADSLTHEQRRKVGFELTRLTFDTWLWSWTEDAIFAALEAVEKEEAQYLGDDLGDK